MVSWQIVEGLGPTSKIEAKYGEAGESHGAKKDSDEPDMDRVAHQFGLVEVLLTGLAKKETFQ